MLVLILYFRLLRYLLLGHLAALAVDKAEIVGGSVNVYC